MRVEIPENSSQNSSLPLRCSSYIYLTNNNYQHISKVVLNTLYDLIKWQSTCRPYTIVLVEPFVGQRVLIIVALNLLIIGISMILLLKSVYVVVAKSA